MYSAEALQAYQVDRRLNVHVFSSKSGMGGAAAAHAADVLRQAIGRRGRARVVVATGPSQDELIDSLVARADIDWTRIEVFHMDEYVGIQDSHTASFRRWLRGRVVDLVHPAKAYYMDGDAADLECECRRYSALLNAAPIDLCFVGFGENGHIAFNDPHTADFDDPLTVKQVTLDDACRGQQVNEGHFPNLHAVPTHAITLTCPALLGAETLICCVPDRRKANAVQGAVLGPVSPACPASLVRTHPQAFLYLDAESASLLENGR